MKSHDCHVFMQRMLPIATRDFLPDNIWGPLTEISNFFRAICASEITVTDMEKLEEPIVITLCKLEKIFPSGFFDSVEHLVIHLAYKAKVREPVQYVGCTLLKARVEGSICEVYLLTEITNFYSHYFGEDIGIYTHQNRLSRNEVARNTNMGTELQLFELVGRLFGVLLLNRVFTPEEYKAAHLYVLLNCEEAAVG